MTINSQAKPKRRSIRSLAAVVVFALGLVALTGCGSSSSTSSSASTPEAPAASTPTTTTPAGSGASESSGSASSALNIEANPEGGLSYNVKALTAKAGKVTVDFKNMSEVGHNVTVESSAGATVGATPTISGESKTLSLNLKPGTYKFFCSVPGHRQGGMEGTLVVK